MSSAHLLSDLFLRISYFDAIINGILISIQFLLMVFGNTTDFYKLTYPTNLLNSIICSSSYFVDSLGFIHELSCNQWRKMVLYLSFQLYAFSFLFLLLWAWLESLLQRWRKEVRINRLAFSPISKEKHSVFHHEGWYFAVIFCRRPLSGWKRSLVFLICWEF